MPIMDAKSGVEENQTPVLESEHGELGIQVSSWSPSVRCEVDHLRNRDSQRANEMLRQKMAVGMRHLLSSNLLSTQSSGARTSINTGLPRSAGVRCASHIAVSSEDPSDERYKHILRSGPHTFRGDLGAEWGAGGTAPEPKDYAFAALAMCTSMTVRLYAERRKWPLKHVEVTVIEEGGGPGLVPDGLHMVLKLEGDLTLDQKNTLMDISKKCPIKQMFMGKMPDGVKVELDKRTTLATEEV